MVSREQKRAAVLHEKLQLLRSITKSHAVILCISQPSISPFQWIPLHLNYIYLLNNNIIYIWSEKSQTNKKKFAFEILVSSPFHPTPSFLISLEKEIPINFFLFIPSFFYINFFSLFLWGNLYIISKLCRVTETR